MDHQNLLQASDYRWGGFPVNSCCQHLTLAGRQTKEILSWRCSSQVRFNEDRLSQPVQALHNSRILLFGEGSVVDPSTLWLRDVDALMAAAWHCVK